jgi:hypothetical protein
MRHPSVAELITGDENRTIVLPYRAPARAKAVLEERFSRGLSNNGARTWIFSDLNTAQQEDFTFTLLNTTNFDATVSIELYFASRKQAIQGIRATVPSMALQTLSVIGEEVERNVHYFNWMALDTLGIPENATFAVRFLSDRPIVVTHKKHTASYHTND